MSSPPGRAPLPRTTTLFPPEASATGDSYLSPSGCVPHSPVHSPTTESLPASEPRTMQVCRHSRQHVAFNFLGNYHETLGCSPALCRISKRSRSPRARVFCHCALPSTGGHHTGQGAPSLLGHAVPLLEGQPLPFQEKL